MHFSQKFLYQFPCKTTVESRFLEQQCNVFQLGYVKSALSLKNKIKIHAFVEDIDN